MSGTLSCVGRRLAMVVLSGLMALACDESSDSAGDDGSSGAPNTGGTGGTSSGSSSGGVGGASAGSSSTGTGGTSAGSSSDTGGTSAGSSSGGATSGGAGTSGAESGGAAAGMSGAGGCGAEAGEGNGGGAGVSVPWTCVKVDDLCECAHDSNGTLPSCAAELNCCMTFLVPDPCSPEERCFCQPATEEQCLDALARTEPIYMAVRTESCPP